MTIQLRYVLGVALAAPLLAASPAHAQVQVQVTAPGVSVMVPPPPTIQFSAPPPLVVVSPGVQVVPDHDEEIFFVDNYYWVRRGRYWYRSPDYRGGWVAYQGGGPRAIVRYKPGKFRHWHARGGAVVAAPGAVVPPPRRRGAVVVAPPAPGVVVVEPGRGHGKHHGRGHGRRDD